jgi:hypothetical protein
MTIKEVMTIHAAYFALECVRKGYASDIEDALNNHLPSDTDINAVREYLNKNQPTG